jgi:hypothetical protein
MLTPSPVKMFVTIQKSRHHQKYGKHAFPEFGHPVLRHLMFQTKTM